ncbi:ATP-dependent DNA ligase [Agromyces sp. Marseille-P2726]|uniref:DUF7882 family protein n=1 Tax=Agromyces sp. Marseille-P2726 TaxID=2709132 RepID=UPI00156D7F90|nr:ATP-dependent DNA ligase [Agromyces sp. Marseille-P2726]
MGIFQHNDATFEVDDEVLAHLQIVIVERLRRGETLTLSWIETDHGHGGMTTVLLNPTHGLIFEVATPDPVIDPVLIERLAVAADSSEGLTLRRANPSESWRP